MAMLTAYWKIAEKDLWMALSMALSTVVELARREAALKADLMVESKGSVRVAQSVI